MRKNEFIKDFDGWNETKKELNRASRLSHFAEGDVWWCGVGANIGAEIDGKNRLHERPVVVLKKLSKYNFIGIPLTSQLHKGSWYVDFVFKRKMQIANVAQVKNFSVFRLYRKMGELSTMDFEKIKLGLNKLLQ